MKVGPHCMLLYHTKRDIIQRKSSAYAAVAVPGPSRPSIIIRPPAESFDLAGNAVTTTVVRLPFAVRHR